ncbi:MAG: hypothetical protein BGN88_06485 [Clostridiales bacterium 43-6]|nr:MAG: hypothetical protein BGN88_06485 [Clostridiales bacterium 43-6]
MNVIGSYALPLMIAGIILLGLFRTENMFNLFLDGATDGLKTMIKIIPSLIGLITAVEMFKASGALDVMTGSLTPVANFLHIPRDVIPIAIIRPVSSGGAIAMLDKILATVGPDSMSGRIASVMCGSCETTVYTTTVYYGAVGVSKIRHTLIAAFTADFAAMIMSSVACGFIFS